MATVVAWLVCDMPPTSSVDAEAARKAEGDACLYPAIEPHATGFLPVTTAAGTTHAIYWEECGNPTGKPVVILHGGPGAGCSPKQRRFHDPVKYRIVLFDQRGCGRSTPDGSLDENTTWDLVADIERLRVLLGIDKWQVFGGSWGSTLALVYAVTHPARVAELILRGIFLVQQSELDYIYQSAAPLIFPEAYARLAGFVPAEERGFLVSAYRKRVMSDDSALANVAAQRWCQWEDAISQLHPMPDEEWNGSGGEQRIHLHYMWNRGFFAYDGWLLDECSKVLGDGKVPTVIVHGRYDIVCPPASAFALSQAIPHAVVTMVADSGHSAWEPGTTRALVEATGQFEPV